MHIIVFTNALKECHRHINACPAGKMTEIANVIHENIKSLDRIHLGENSMPSDKTYKQYTSI